MARLGRIAIDFGTSAIKLIQVGGKANAPKIEKIDMEPVAISAEDAAADVFPRAAVVAAVKALLARQKLKIKKAAVTIPGQSAIIRTLKVPDGPPDRLAQMIRFEAEPLVPFPLDDCAFGYRILEQAPGATGPKRLLFIAVKNERLNDYVDVLRELNIIPELIEVAPYSSALAFRDGHPDEKETVAVIDFGEGTTDISILQNGELVFTRAASVAGGTFTQAIASKLEISRGEAERLKKEKAKLSAVAQARPGGGRPAPAGRPAGPSGSPPAPGAGPRPPGPPAGIPGPGVPPPAGAPGVVARPGVPGAPPAVPPPSGVGAPAIAPPAPGAGAPPPPPAAGPKPPGPPAPPAPGAGAPPPPPAAGPKPPGPPAPPAPGAGAPPPPPNAGPRPLGPPSAGGGLMGAKPPAPPAAGGGLMGAKPPAPPSPGGLMGAKPPAPPAPGGLLGAKPAGPGGPPPPNPGGLLPRPPAPPSGGQEAPPAPAASPSDDLGAIVQPLAERLLAEIRRSLEFYTAQEDGSPITRIYITGGGCQMEGLREFLTARLNLEVRDTVVLGRAKLPGPMPAGAGGYACAYGLALRLLAPADVTVNLLPSDLSARLAESSQAVWQQYAGVLGVVLLLQGVAFAWFAYSGRKAIVETLRAEYDGQVMVGGQPLLIDGRPVLNKEVLERLADVEKRRDQLEERFDTIRELEVNKYDWIAIMEGIRRTIPENTWLTDGSLTFNSTGITINLKTTQEENARIFYRNITSSQYLTYAGAGISLQRTQENGVDIWSWNAPLTFKFQPIGSADEVAPGSGGAP